MIHHFIFEHLGFFNFLLCYFLEGRAISWFKNSGLPSDFFNMKNSLKYNINFFNIKKDYWRSSSLVKEYQNVKAFHVYCHMYHLVETSLEVYTN